jgi:hypothetical protein
VIPLLAVMVGTYIVARGFDQLARLAPRSEVLRALATILAVAAIVVAILCAAQIVLLAERLDRDMTEAAQTVEQLLR